MLPRELNLKTIVIAVEVALTEAHQDVLMEEVGVNSKNWGTV